MSDSPKFFTDELEKLLAMPLNTKEDLDAWDAASQRLRDTIRSQHREVEYESETYHFLVDAEIRQRDAGYRKWQEGEVRHYIEKVRAQK
jgi:hypothetical protein